MRVLTLARKPIEESTVVENVTRWGTGSINVDGCRIKTGDASNYRKPSPNPQIGDPALMGSRYGKIVGSRNDDWQLGRWPANMILSIQGTGFEYMLKRIMP